MIELLTLPNKEISKRDRVSIVQKLKGSRRKKRLCWKHLLRKPRFGKQLEIVGVINPPVRMVSRLVLGDIECRIYESHEVVLGQRSDGTGLQSVFPNANSKGGCNNQDFWMELIKKGELISSSSFRRGFSLRKVEIPELLTFSESEFMFSESEFKFSESEITFSESEIIFSESGNQWHVRRGPREDSKNYSDHWELLLICMLYTYWEIWGVTVANPLNLSDFRPISLIGVFYKVVAKVLALRLKKVIGKVISEPQSAFIKGRNILDGVLINNEVVDFVRNKRRTGLIFKVDFEKAYATVDWDFLLDTMKRMGFGKKWIGWISVCLRSSSMSVLVNGSPSREFLMGKGLRQGDSLVPFLFLMVAENLHLLVEEAKAKGLYEGLPISNKGLEISHL
ncbi:hypothetical protein OSB04_un001199 [Centaurea solstitialis]|uniref:Reverse transcriptase domain-containing protein n=1 Tax=Centaurea solstitialis TaxID=347529 RepID=A0AA38S3M2_9ASTR|nr:hypothetical protein OSB04_un001199 [Centaurea solstitialis]